ncbi:MAG: tRNA 2-selenouridine(34) synthase MnmH [Verrucomicrobia bacterium]|nr:tRNA 2-selenouridine(34) synthase MnmH [Verrucomicrobiota bacterium]
MIVDVRSPSEFAQGHIPGSASLPLFSDQERAQVGTLYKRNSPLEAYQLGLGIVAAKAEQFIEAAYHLSAGAPLKLYCARGGLRSHSSAKLLQLAGLTCSTLPGGYKAYRKEVRETFLRSFDLRILGGFTGSGKTALLYELEKKGEAILDLEALAHHKGSSYGHLGKLPQPSQEHFENVLAEKLRALCPSTPLWIEDESRMIGSCQIPEPLFQQMRQAPLFFVQRSFEERVAYLLDEYGSLPSDALKQATSRIMKKLGGERTDQALKALERGAVKEAISLILPYYDKTYLHCLKRRSCHFPHLTPN